MKQISFKINIFLIFLSTLLISSLAYAKVWDLKIKEPHPFFAGAGIGYGAGVADGIGINAYGGYSFNQNIGLEGDLFITPAYQTKGHTYSIAATGKISFPLPNRMIRHLTPYALAGMAFTTWPSPAGTHVGLALGAGADYRLQHNVELGCKWLSSLGSNTPTIIVLTGALRF